MQPSPRTVAAAAEEAAAVEVEVEAEEEAAEGGGMIEVATAVEAEAEEEAQVGVLAGETHSNATISPNHAAVRIVCLGTLLRRSVCKSEYFEFSCLCVSL